MLAVTDKLLPVAGPGGTGASAYQVWLTQPGNAGKTQAQFIASLKGADGVTQDISGKLDGTTAALIALFDALPQLPTDPTQYPTAGGLFRDGDANGYRLVRLYSAS